MAISVITGGDTGDRCEKDFYPTPTCSTQALLDWFEGRELGNILEPFAGAGHIVKAIEDNYTNYKSIRAFDLHKYPNVSKTRVKIKDFNEVSNRRLKKVDWIITNPPYDRKVLMPLVKRCLEVSNKGVAMFLKITFLETIDRKKFFENNKMLKKVLVFSNRQPMKKGGIYQGGSNAICYCWFIWEKSYSGNPEIGWLDNSKSCNTNKKKGIY